MTTEKKKQNPCEKCPAFPCVSFGVIDGRDLHSEFLERQKLQDNNNRHRDRDGE